MTSSNLKYNQSRIHQTKRMHFSTKIKPIHIAWTWTESKTNFNMYENWLVFYFIWTHAPHSERSVSIHKCCWSEEIKFAPQNDHCCSGWRRARMLWHASSMKLFNKREIYIWLMRDSRVDWDLRSANFWLCYSNCMWVGDLNGKWEMGNPNAGQAKQKSGTENWLNHKRVSNMPALHSIHISIFIFATRLDEIHMIDDTHMGMCLHHYIFNSNSKAITNAYAHTSRYCWSHENV